MEVLTYFGAFFSLIGSIFLFLGALGVLRMPDVYNRMQAGTKATTLGSILFLFGVGISHIGCNCSGRLFLLMLFIIFTNPISSHALARAAHFKGIKLTDKSVRDCLKSDEENEEGECS